MYHHARATNEYQAATPDLRVAMSSKFNHQQKLQKVPAVCKEAPPPLPNTLEMFSNYPLQAYASWKGFGSPISNLVVGQTTLRAFPDLNLHLGVITGNPYSLSIVLQFNPFTLKTQYTVELLDRRGILDQRSITVDQPQPGLPYEIGLFTWEDFPPTSLVRSKAFS